MSDIDRDTYGVDLLVFGAHPDDAEIGMGGTIAKHAASGLRVALCDLTLAELSSNGTVEERQREAAIASEALGVAERSNLKLPDRGLFMTKENIDAITLEIRRLRPRIVFAPYWIDRHPDHIACGQLVEQAVFNAKLRRYLPDSPPSPVKDLYFYFINDVHSPDLIVDVSGTHPVKMNSLTAYRSQFEKLGPDAVDTPLTQGYLTSVEARDRSLGKQIGTAYAEGFASKRPVRIDFFQ